MRRCIICGNPCGFNSKYCRGCGKELRNNRKITGKIKRKFGIKVCPMCFENAIKSDEVFCWECRSRFKRRVLSHKKKIEWKDVKRINLR